MNSDADASEVDQASEVLFDDPAETDADGQRLISLIVTDAGSERLDRWLAARLPDRSRSEIQRWIEAGLVTIGTRTLKASYRPSAGDEITAIVPPPEVYSVEPEPISLDIIFEDKDLLVVNKPAGMVVHPAAGHPSGTLVNAVLFHCPDLEGVGGMQRPGIVHRLDKDTSGLILVAKNDGSQRALQEQFKARSVRKTYIALVYGWLTPESGEINAAIGRDPRSRQRMAVVQASHGRAATTRYEVVQYYREQPYRGLHVAAQPTPGVGRHTLVACHPLTGRTHQIRVHLAYVRHPIVGDELYGGRPKQTLSCPRQFLHAGRISFQLPSTGREVEFAVPLPTDLQAVLDRLSAEC